MGSRFCNTSFSRLGPQRWRCEWGVCIVTLPYHVGCPKSVTVFANSETVQKTTGCMPEPRYNIKVKYDFKGFFEKFCQQCFGMWWQHRGFNVAGPFLPARMSVPVSNCAPCRLPHRQAGYPTKIVHVPGVGHDYQPFQEAQVCVWQWEAIRSHLGEA